MIDPHLFPMLMQATAFIIVGVTMMVLGGLGLIGKGPLADLPDLPR